jgi:hypothetical protein
MVSKMLKVSVLILIALTLPACGQQFTGSAYKVQAGRTTDQLFDKGVSAWQVGAEFQFKAKCGGCHALLPKDQRKMPV